MRDCPNLKSHEKGSVQSQTSVTSDALKKKTFYALHFRGEQETSTDVVNNLLKIFTLDVYVYLIRVLLCPSLHH